MKVGSRLHSQLGGSTLCVGMICCVLGCRGASETARLRIDLEKTGSTIERLERDVQQRDGTIAGLHQQVANLQGFTGDRPAALFAPTHIEIVKRSGGADYDGLPGDDGITIYLRPVDADGDPVKAPGKITVEILDHTTPGSPKIVSVHRFERPEVLRRLWFSRFSTSHYTLKCDFPSDYQPPASRRLSVNVSFVDFLTGSVLTAIQEVTVSMPDR